MKSAPYEFGRDGMIFIGYVDDMLIFGKHQSDIDHFKANIAQQFVVKDFGRRTQVQIIKIDWSGYPRSVGLYQSKLIQKLFTTHYIQDAKLCSTPMALEKQLS